METFKLVSSGRLRSVHEHLSAQAIAVDQTMREAHSMWPHWVADSVAEVPDLLIVKVRNGFVFERHNESYKKVKDCAQILEVTRCPRTLQLMRKYRMRSAVPLQLEAMHAALHSCNGRWCSTAQSCRSLSRTHRVP